MTEKILHSFEAGRRGKPDELESQIANLIGAYFLELNPESRFDLRVTGDYSPTGDKLVVVLGGEVSDFLLKTHNFNGNISKIILDHYNTVHRTAHGLKDFDIFFEFKPQDHELAVNRAAGDSGNPIAVAYRFGPFYLPWERYLAVEIRDCIDSIHQQEGIVPQRLSKASGIAELKGLKADGKIRVDALYNGTRIDRLTGITIAVEHNESLNVEELRSQLGTIVRTLVRADEALYNVCLGEPTLKINSLGAWNHGGWKVDAGSREAKPYRDCFATYGCNEDSFSGEDPTKPSATGTLLARHIALHIVYSGLADFARVALTYNIGEEEPGLNIWTNGTAKIPQTNLENWIKDNVPLTINGAIELFGLRDAKLYRQVVEHSDYFQRPSPWNNLHPELFEKALKYIPERFLPG